MNCVVFSRPELVLRLGLKMGGSRQDIKGREGRALGMVSHEGRRSLKLSSFAIRDSCCAHKLKHLLRAYSNVSSLIVKKREHSVNKQKNIVSVWWYRILEITCAHTDET